MFVCGKLTNVEDYYINHESQREFCLQYKYISTYKGK